jgi:hypothetical protein
MPLSKIINVAAHHTRDLARCADTFLNIERCPGGRPIVAGLTCPHCGIDPSDGDCNGVNGFKKGEKRK